MSIDWGIPRLRSDRLATVIPSHVSTGGLVTNPAYTLFLWRTAALEKARDCTLAFYVWDDKLEQLWTRARHYTARFLQHEVAALVEPDFSLWADSPLVVQLWNTYRTRRLGLLWQDAGLPVIPSLNWSDERSYEFCFVGIPKGAPVVAVECRTAGQADHDRRAFLRGLMEGLRQVQPEHLIVYGGQEHSFWLSPHLPRGILTTLLPSWTHQRDKIRRREARAIRDRYQFQLFTTGDSLCNESTAAL
jgi:hypothetical protein